MKAKISIEYPLSIVGTGVPDGPMSYRSQIAYLSIAKIKIIYGNNIFTFCLRTAEDVGPYKFDINFMFRQQTNARRYAFLHPTHPPQAVPLLSQEKAPVNRAFWQQTDARR